MQLLPHVLPALGRGLSSSVGALILVEERYCDQSPGATVPAERCDWNNRIQRHVNTAGQTIETQYGVDR